MEGVVKCSAQLSSLSLIFRLLMLSAEEWGVIRSRSSHAFLFFYTRSLTNLFVFFSVYLCTLSQEDHLCLNHFEETEFVALINWRLYHNIFLFQFPHAVDWSRNGFKQDLQIYFCIRRSCGFHWYIKSEGTLAGIRMSNGIAATVTSAIAHRGGFS